MLPKILGIVNVTPDSFSDGGHFFDTEAAIAQGVALYEQGADIIDVGGESTRPGAQRVSQSEEHDRVIPVIRALCERGITVSIDTMRAPIAQAGIAAGASYINDVSGGKADPEIFDVANHFGVHYILMHWRAHSVSMQEFTHYEDVVNDVISEVSTQVAAARAAGVRDEQIILDPGLGFAKDSEHNWQLLDRIVEFQAQGLPVLIGHSRKRFLRLGREHVTTAQLDQATAAVSALAAYHGVWGIRVHNVAASKLAMEVAGFWKREAQC